jgi:hypothetical protein
MIVSPFAAGLNEPTKHPAGVRLDPRGQASACPADAGNEVNGAPR